MGERHHASDPASGSRAPVVPGGNGRRYHRARRNGIERSGWVLVVIALCGVACTHEQPGEGIRACDEISMPAPAAPDTSVILIVNDAMRRDRLGAYGGPAKTPAFDAFADENSSSSVPLPRRHGPSRPSQRCSPPSIRRSTASPRTRSSATRSTPTAAAPIIAADAQRRARRHWRRSSQAAGYRTAAFVSNPWIEKRFGFDQGFDVYDDSFARWGCTGDVVSAPAALAQQHLPPGPSSSSTSTTSTAICPTAPSTARAGRNRAAQLAADTGR